MKFKEKLNEILSEGKDKKLTKDDIRKMAINGEDVTKLDVSHIKDFSEMFKDLKDFNQDISKWNTKNAVDMTEMFSDATKFKCNLNKWNTKKVKDADYIFDGADAMSFFDIESWNWNFDVDPDWIEPGMDDNMYSGKIQNITLNGKKVIDPWGYGIESDVRDSDLYYEIASEVYDEED